MAITKEVRWAGSFDEYACVSLQRKTVYIDGETGEEMEKFWRRVVTPDDDLVALAADLNLAPAVATRLGDIITAARYPEAVARYEARKAASGGQV